MRSLTCLLESRVYSSKNLRSTVQKDFCNTICQLRTHALQQNRGDGLPSSHSAQAALGARLLIKRHRAKPKSMRPTTEAASLIERMGATLLRHSFNGGGAEFRVLVANLTGLFVVGLIAPGLCFFEAVPHLNGNAGRWWRSFK